ncbi:uncharacterized protein RAG0_08565 [Rhynchosporium agropyri]|uniref:Ubiquitin 3 binding protein But2 C-terminal domain-containing protein n=1 Tax=Rhynchosporium agropyri TaxID=914238 RepID=A0A1E1KRD5_9HELO|nr:uncharacterized protein RAG0_08565 [Rhynchosporium agropyri]
MQSIITLTFALLASTIAALPAGTSSASTTVQITNDFSGRSANIAIPLTNTKQALSTLLRGTALDNNNNAFPATSFFLQANFGGVQCDLFLDAGVTVSITERKTFAAFAPTGSPKDLSGAQIACFLF